MRTEIVVGRKSFGDIKKVLQDAKNWHGRLFDRLARYFRRIIFMCIQKSNFMTLAKWDSAPAGASGRDSSAAEKDPVPTEQGSQLRNRILRPRNTIMHPWDRLARIFALAG